MNQIDDMAVAHGAGQANVQLQQMLAPLVELFKQAEQVVQQKMPKPQLPPNEQAALQIATMDNARKTELDKATVGMKQQEFAARQQELAAEQRLAQMETQAKAQQQAFDQWMEQQTAAALQRDKEYAQQVEIIKNNADNQQHQLTEITKNNQDNQTAILIKRLEMLQADVAGVATAQQAAPTPADTMGPLIEAMTQQLGGLAEAHAKTAETHAQSMEKLHKHLTAPKRLVKDPVTGEKRVEVISVDG